MPAEQLMEEVTLTKEELTQEILNDYKMARLSRETSLLGRREVLTGKAKFGIFGDGKELPQIALAKQFQDGDWRSGYYRDQTILMSLGLLNIQQFFAQLYAHPDSEAEPASAGRQMNGHYGTHTLNEDGTWKNLAAQKNISADISPTAGQMPRLLGLGYASKFFRNNPELKDHTKFSDNGNEIAWGTIGDASTSEGMFWEAINAAGVLQVPVVMSVWDDGHGISVPKKYQTTKSSISEALKGFQRDKENQGWEILTVKGWDYANLCLTYEKAADIAREKHIPVLVHVQEVTQPQGHSTSGSHERYKSKDRLAWEAEYDGIAQFKKWILEKGLATEEGLNELDEAAKKEVRNGKKAAWSAYAEPIKAELNHAVALINTIGQELGSEEVEKIGAELKSAIDPMRKDILEAAHAVLLSTVEQSSSSKTELVNWLEAQKPLNHSRYSSHLTSESEYALNNIETIAPTFTDQQCDGREIIRDNFDKLLAEHPELIIFGEDAGKIGGVNQGLEGLQDKYGEHRVFDTGIRECTIMGQAIGMAMRGLRPVAEIQYLDYLLYAIQIMSDDLATVQYRTKGRQKAPVIIRTRGHRLEGIWHSGSPMGMILNAVRGINVCVPRNMTQAAGMYNTLLASDEPGLVIESLNGYRLKENQPENLGEYRIPFGEIETMREGSDITVVTYGSMVRMAEVVAMKVAQYNIDVEVIDVQTLLPFDNAQAISASIEKTNRVLFVDEDVEGGASAYMMQQVLEKQGAYKWLDSAPKTLHSKNHRPAYGTDGDYFSKPNNEDIFNAIYAIMQEANPEKYPDIYA